MTTAIPTVLPLLTAAVIAWVTATSVSTGRITLYNRRHGRPLVIKQEEPTAFWSMILLMSVVMVILLLSAAGNEQLASSSAAVQPDLNPLRSGQLRRGAEWLWIGAESGTSVGFRQAIETALKLYIAGVQISADRDPSPNRTFQKITGSCLS